MQVGLLYGAHVVWDCLFNTGYPGFGVPVPLFIGYLISNLILLKTNVIMSRDPKSVKSLAQVWPVPLFIVYLISNLILLKTNVIMSRDPKSVKSLAQVWLCVGLVFSVSHSCIP